MIVTVLIGLAAGCASALMFVSIISGALTSLPLLYLAPLPLMVAAIGWSPLVAAIGGIAASLSMGAMFGLPLGIAFAIGVALPGCWLGHLVLLGKPSGRSASGSAAPSIEPELEWYPLGRILLWIVGLAALTTFAALLTFGTDAATITDTLRQGLTSFFSRPDHELALPEIEQWIEPLVSLAPITAAAVAVPTLALNLWLAAKITATSGRLRRPWPCLRTVTLPPMTLGALCLAVVFCFSGGLTGLAAKVIASALILAYAIIGFAVLHTLTLTLKSRTFWLGSVYAIVMMFAWPVLAIAVLGLADSVFSLRARYLRTRPPPLPAP